MKKLLGCTISVACLVVCFNAVGANLTPKLKDTPALSLPFVDEVQTEEVEGVYEVAIEDSNMVDFSVLEPEESRSWGKDTNGVVPVIVSPPAWNDTAVFSWANIAAEFPSGQAALYEYIADNIRHPIPIEKGDVKRSICQFIVELDGTISNVVVVRSAGDLLLDKEAIRLVYSMPKWKPAILQEKAVRYRVTIPITFQGE